MKSLFILLIACLLARGAVAAENVIEPKMVKVPAGKIDSAGCPVGVAICQYHEYVERMIDVAAFEIGATEVTFAEYDACVNDGGCASPVSTWAFENRPVNPPCVADQPCQYPHDESWGRGKRPVINVSWDDAQRYLKWLNEKTGGKYRLPTSAEWEHAALAGAKTDFPWGPKLGKKNANCDGCGSQWDNKQTAPVASFKPNKFGAYDMVGNVNEWTSSCFPLRERGSQQCRTYIYRGGSWMAIAKSMNPRFFNDLDAMLRETHIGFRLAR